MKVHAWICGASFWASLLLYGTTYAAEAENAPVDQRSYDLVFQEYDRYGELKQRKRDRAAIAADAFDTSLPTEKMVDALVELGLASSPEEIPWKKLLELAERLGMPESVAFWAVVSAGKALCCSPRPRDLERWLFLQLKSDRQQTRSAVIVLGMSRIARHVTLREWARMLRDPATSDETCECICNYAYVWGLVGKGVTFDEGVNCLLAGYDEVLASPQRKLLIWETLGDVPDAATQTNIEDTTLWALHVLAMSEFANTRNPEPLRSIALTGLRRGEVISMAALSAAQKVRDEKIGTEQLQSAADHLLHNAAKYGTEK